MKNQFLKSRPCAGSLNLKNLKGALFVYALRCNPAFIGITLRGGILKWTNLTLVGQSFQVILVDQQNGVWGPIDDSLEPRIESDREFDFNSL